MNLNQQERNLSLLALLRLDRSLLQPAAERFSSTGAKGYRRDYHLCELLEGYLWLALGVALGLFPGDKARLVARQRFAASFRLFPTLLERWGFLFDSQVADIVQIALSHDEFFRNTNLREFEHPERLEGIFQLLYGIEVEFSEDVNAQEFVYTLAFKTAEALRSVQNASRQGRSLNLLENIFTGQSGATRLGFFKVVDRMIAFRDLTLSNDLAIDSIEERDRWLFRDRVKQLARWRTDFHRSEAQELFLAIALIVSEEFDPVVGINPRLLQFEFLDLMKEWGAGGNRALQAGQ